MTEHLGYDKHDPAGRNGANSRNGTRTKSCGPRSVRSRWRCRASGTEASIVPSLTALRPDRRALQSRLHRSWRSHRPLPTVDIGLDPVRAAGA